MFLKPHKVCRLWIGVMALLSIWCTACGKEGEQEGSGEVGYVYRGEQVSFPDPASKMRIMKVYGDSLYYIVAGGDEGRIMYEAPIGNGIDMEGITEFISPCDEEGEYLVDYEVAESGECNFLFRRSDGIGCVLVKRFRDGREACRLGLPEVYGGLNFRLGLAVDGEGYVYLLSEDGIYQVGPEGELCGSVSTGAYRQGGMDERLLKGEDGRIYYCAGYKLNSYAIYELIGGDTPRLEKRANSPEGEVCSNLYPSRYGLLCDAESALYQYRGDGWEKVLEWGESNIYHPWSGLIDLVQADEESFVLKSFSLDNYDAEIICCLRRMDASGLPEKEELVLASMYRSGGLERAVASFNLASDRYHVTIEDYEWGGGGDEAEPPPGVLRPAGPAGCEPA